MNSKCYLYVQLLSVVALFAMTGCTEDELEGHRTAAGDGIVFGATAGYANPDTKTVYGDYNGTSSQEINWESDDEVEIYSPSSASQQALYSISGDIDNGSTNEDSPSSAGLAAKGDAGLTWGAESTQSFYAIYPSVESIQNEAVKKRVSFSEGVLKGYIPINQQHTITKNGSNWEAEPNMDYLYMAAIEESFPVPAFDAEQKGVSLNFVPLTSTLEITFVGPMDHPMASFNVFADDGEAIAGNFTCNLKEGTDCTPTSSGATNNYVTVSTYWNDGGTQRPLKLDAGEEITFNVFLLPHQDLSNLSIRVAGFNAASVTMKLQGTGANGTSFVVQPHQKTIVKVNAPKSFGNTNEWITGLDDNVLVSQLSIPGTANSFSFMRNEGVDSHYQTQTATIEEQWNAGIRCFELRGPNSSSSDLADAPLQCNRQNLGITFGEAVRQINELLQKHPGEFAMIMPAFESGEGRFVKEYAENLNNFYKNHNYEYKTYGRNLTVGEARGHLLFIARITSEEDAGKTIDDPVQGVSIDEWGSLKDNWQRRGYPVANWARNVNWGTAEQMEYYMINNNRLENFVEQNLPVKGTVDYMHTTKRNDGSEGSAYVQDWARVVPEEAAGQYELYSDYDYSWSIWGESWSLNYTQYVYWAESFGEKCKDVWSTFEKAIEDNNNRQGSTFYINSLDGYFVDKTIRQSYVPYIEGRSDSYRPNNSSRQSSFSYGEGGKAGNIGAFATAINSYFYNAILDYGADNIYGPMNIVILDRVYVDEPSSYLPSVIINNNYRFPLLTSEDVAGN